MNTTSIFLQRWHLGQPCGFFYRTATDVKRGPHKVTADITVSPGPYVHNIFTLGSICPASHYQPPSQCLLKLSLTGCVCVVFVRKRCRNWTGGWRTSTVSWGSLSWAGSTWRSPTRSCWASHRYFFSTALGGWGWWGGSCVKGGSHGFQVGLQRKDHCSFYDVQAYHLYPLLVLAEGGEQRHTLKRSPTPLSLWSEPAP